MTWSEFAAHVVAHPYPDPMLLGGLYVGLGFCVADDFRQRRLLTGRPSYALVVAFWPLALMVR